MKLFYDVIDIIANISWTADIFAALVALALGFVWFHPLTFGRTWSQLSGKELTGEKLKITLPLSFLCFLFLAANITAFCKHFDWQTVDKGFLLGYDLGIMICFFMAIYALYEQRAPKRYLIEAGFVLFSMSAMGVAVAVVL